MVLGSLYGAENCSWRRGASELVGDYLCGKMWPRRTCRISGGNIRQRSLENRPGVDEGLHRRFPKVSDKYQTAVATDICEIIVLDG